MSSDSSAVLVHEGYDPDKNCNSIFYCSAAIRFPHIEMVVFSHRECSFQH